MVPRSTFDKRRIILAGTSLAALALAGAAHAGPSGGTVSAGSASIAGDGTGRVTVTQTSDRAILDWTGFSIGTGESARFIQPGSTSVAVNRVTGADPSSILGSLTANGRVVLINRNGIAFGKDATVDVGGLVATTADIDRQAFMATGSLNFSGGSLPGASPGASIVNEGRITVRDAGLAALVAPSVRNSGTIVANLGRVALGAGTGFTVDFYGDGLVSFAPDGIVAATVGDGGAALVENSGVIAASGGKVLLSAAAARDVVNASVNVSGVVRADGISREGGSIVLSGSGSVTATGTLSADSAEAEGGRIDISGRAVALGGRVSASGRDGGTVDVAAEGALSLAETVTATGALGSGGGISYSAGRIVETSTSRSDASGLIDGGTIRSLADGGIVSSGHYAAAGRFGRGGRIDMTGADVSLLSATFDARGRQAGGLVRIGGAFQGGKTPDPSKPYHQSFLGRWGALPGLAKADSVFVSSGSRIDVSASGGAGGTAVIWSEDRTTFLGAIDARGAAGGTTGGAAEISSAGDLRQASLMDVHVGGGHLLLDPKNIVIGNTGDVSGWSYQGIIGAGYFSTRDADAGLDAGDAFGNAVALNAAGDRMAVGASGDDGTGNLTLNVGAVYLFSFGDSDFSNGTLAGIVGKGYAGGKNINVAQLADADAFGVSVALNAAGDRMAVGALGDDGSDESASGSGAVYLFSFADGNFSGGTHAGTIGKAYSGAGDIAVSTEESDGFGRSVALNAAGDRLAIGAWNEGGSGNAAPGSGAVYLVSFADANFGGGVHTGTIGHGYASAGSIDMAAVVDADDQFGISVALNAAGDRLVVGARYDNGFDGGDTKAGAVHLFTFADGDFSGGTHAGTIGKGYTGGKNFNHPFLEAYDFFGSSVALNAAGDRLAVGAVGEDGSTGTTTEAGAVFLIGFTDGDFSGGTHFGTIGSGYTGAKNINVALGQQDGFGMSVALNASGNRMVSGAYLDDGTGSDPAANYGAVHLFTFADTDFSGGALKGTIGDGYTANKNLDIPIGGGTGAADGFGAAVALNAAADRMAVGAWYDDGFGDSLDGSGAVYLFSFTDGNFSGGALEGVIGHGYGGGNNVDLTGSLEALDNFGHAVALNAAGDRLAVGAVFDDGTDVAALQADNYGAVYLFTFDPDSKFESGEHVGTLGRGYAGPGSFDVVVDGQSFEGLQKTEYFGASLSFDASGNRLAVGASRTPYDTVTDYRGAVYLFSFTDGDFSNPTPEGMIGHGTPGISLDFNDQFGRGIALSAAGDRLAVGANLDDGFDGGQTNAGAVYLFTFDSTGNFQNPEHAMTIGRGYTGAKGFDVGTNVRAGDVLGHSLSFNNDGTLLAVGAPQHDGAGNDSADSGAVYLFDLSSDLAAVDLRTIIGKGYSGRNVPAAIEAGDQFGHAVALSGIGDRMAVGAKDDDGFDNLPPAAGNAGAVHLLALDFSNGLAYGDVAGSLVNVAASDLALQLSLGTNLTLQANNDITVNTAIAVDNEYGDGGDLTLQAGRSILLNAGIATDGGDLTLIANDDLASGVVNAHRDAGNAVITMGASSSINAGAGSVAIEMRTGAGKTNSGSGSITLRGIAAGAVDVSNAGAAGDILLNGNVATTGAQDYMSERDIRVASATTISVSGAETLNMNAAGQIQMLGTASLQNLSTDPTPFDAIVLKANRRTTPDARNLHGIDLGAGSTIVTAAGGGGKIDLSGRSGTGGGYGIMVNGATIQSQGTGSVTLTGEAIGDVGATSSGVIVLSGGSVLSGDGGIVITALATGLADDRPALYLLGAANPAVVKASGTGSVTLSGTRSNGDGEGIWIGVGNSKVETESGDITLVGVGSDKAGGVKTDGVRLGGTGQVFSTAGGDVTVTATSRGTVADFTTLATASLGSAGTGNITINADRAAIAGTSFITGGGVLTIQPRTDGRSIGLGTGAAGDLQLGDGSLGNPLVDGFSEIVIGNSAAGTINVATALLAFKDNLRLVSGANLLFTGTSAGSPLDVGNNRLTLDIAGTTTQSAGLGAYIKADSLLLTGAGGTYTLTHVGNDIGTLAAGVGTGSVALIHGGSGSLSVGSIGATDGITASSVQLATTNAAADLVLGADVTTSGAQTYTSARNITVDAVDLLVTGKATLGMTAAAQITVLGGTLENAYTGDADSFDAVVLAANDDAAPFSSAGSNAAITLEDGARITTASGGGGAIRMTGKAGTGLADAIGIRIADSTVESPGAGTITIAGTGGAGATGGGKSGVVIGGTTGSRIESSLGDITITGIAGAATSGLANIGVDVAENSTVVSTGNSPDAAGIIVSGTGGGSGGSTLNHGVRLAGALALSSDSGAITVTAAGGSPVSGSDNDGLVLSGTSAVIQSVSGEIVVDAAAGTGGKHLDNLAGSGAVASAGRWIIYLPDPDDTVFGDLASGSLPIWGQTGGTLPPASVGAGNRYVFAFQPTLTASTAFSDDKVYGETFTWPTPVLGTHYDLDGLVDASDYGDVWTQETLTTIGLSGAPVLSSAGAAAGANVAGSPYDISLANGTLANTAGYQFGAPSSTGTLTVTPKTLTLTGVTAADKDYDGDTDADLSGGTLVGIVGSEDVEFSAGSGSFASKNVGTWTVTATGYALTGGDAGNYTLTQPTVADATITAKALTLTGVTAADKAYDGDTDADLSGGTLVGVVGSEDVEFSAGTGSFASRNVGTWTITASGYVLTGDDAGNYTLTQPTVADATITAKMLALTGVTATDKDYDGDGDANLSGGTLAGVIGSDDVGFSAGTGSFASKNVGTWAVTASGYTLTGGDAGNYTLTQPAVADAAITAKALTLTGVTALDRDYDGGADADLSGGTLAGVVSGDDVGFSSGSGSFASRNVGTWSVTAAGYALTGDDAGNYTLAQPVVADATITAKTLTLIGVAAAGKDYDGDADANLSGGTLAGIVVGDDVGFSAGTGSFASKNVGTWSVTASGYALTGDDAGNYTLTQPAVASATITAKALTLTGVAAADKDYDGDDAADLSGGALVGVIGSDDVSFTGGTGAFASKNAGTWAVTASGYALTGGNAGNYTLAQPAVVAATITAKTLTLTGVAAADKAYDGTTGANLSGGTLVGIVGSDDVEFTAGSGAFASRNAGTWSVTASGYALTGDDAGNYTLTQPTVADATITAKALTLTGVAAAGKDYDGGADADLSGGTLAGIVGGDDVGFSAGTGSFATRNVGTWSVIATGYTLTGDDAGNYTLAQPAVAAATITAKTLTLTGVAAADKAYDGTTGADLSGGTLIGIVGSDDVEFSAGSGIFASKNAGTWSVTVTGYTLTGDDAGNYALTQPTVADATITPRTLNAGVAALDKVYDGTRDADLAFSTGDIVDGDTVAFDYEARFADRNAGTDKTVSLTGGVTLTGTDAANYTLAIDPDALSGLTADISARTLTVSTVDALDKVYDGTASADLAFTTVDILSGDAVTFAYTAGFADRNAGTGKGVSVSGVSLSGADGGNYALVLDDALLAGLTADIHRKALTPVGVAARDKTYDGTRSVTLDFTTSGIVSGDDIGFLYEALAADGNAGSGKAVTVTDGAVALGGADAGNYDLGYDPALFADLQIDIAARTLDVTAVTALDKTYDGTTSAALVFDTAGLVGGDTIAIDYSAAFADRHVGTGKSVSATGSITLSGDDAANYVLALDSTLLAGLAADITARALTVSDVAALGKTYDGTRGAALAFTSDAVAGDDIAFGYEALFDDRNAGTGKAVTVTDGLVALTGTDAGNYVLVVDPALLGGLTADIAKKSLVVTDVAGIAKTYDGSRSAELDFGTDDIVAGDDIGFDYEALAADRNAGTGKAVIVTGGAVALAGGDAANYDLVLDPGLLSGLSLDIAARTVTIGAVAAEDKVYDGTRTASLAITWAGIVGGDDAAFGYDARFTDKNVGIGKPVTVTGSISLNGADAGNYVVALDPALLGGLSADISAKTLGVADVLALGKTYDGSRSAELAFVTDDIVDGDNVAFDYEALFADRNAGAGKAVGVTGGAVALTGTDAGNYTLSLDAALLLGLGADIGRRTLTVTGVAAADKTYDGTRNVALDFTTADILAGDDVGFDYAALAADRNAGTGKAVAVAGVSLSGEDAGNYDLALAGSLLGGLTIDVAAKSLTVVVDDRSRPRFLPNPAFTYHLVGLAEGDDAAVVSGVTFLTTATDASPVGQYAIAAAGGSAPNYILVYTPGTLTVTGHLIPPYDQDRIVHVPGSLSGGDGFGGLVSITPMLTLHTLAGYAEGSALGDAALDGRGPFCSDPGNRSRGRRLFPHLQLNMSGRTLYCLGSPSRFAQ